MKGQVPKWRLEMKTHRPDGPVNTCNGDVSVGSETSPRTGILGVSN